MVVMFVFSLLVVLSSVSVTLSTDPPGHLQPLGSHKDPQDIEEISEFPHPFLFYENYIKYGKPVLFKSILQKTDSKLLRDWNDEYLRKKFGDQKVVIEYGKKENRNDGMEEVKLSTFLKTYKEKDIYMVQDLTPQMMEDVPLSPSLRCGGPQNMLAKAIMWFSSGGTKSVLHMDEFDNINCLLDGTKDFIIFDQVYGADIEYDGYVWQGSYSSVDVDRVDMYKFPRLQDLPYYKAHMETGDCLFIPTRWYHQVNSHGSRNLAVNVWFYHPYWFNVTDCAGEKWNTTASLNTYPIAGIQEGLRDIIITSLDMENSLTEDMFLENWYSVSINDAENSKLFKHLDADNDGLLTWDEVYKFDVEHVYKMFPKSFGNDFREYYREKKGMLEDLFAKRSDGEGVLKDEL